MPSYGIQYPHAGPFDGYLQFEACVPGVAGVWYTAYTRSDEKLECFMAVFLAGEALPADPHAAIYTQRFHPQEAPLTQRIPLPRPGIYRIAYRGQKLTGSLRDLFQKNPAARGQFFITLTDWDFGRGKTRPINPESIVLKDLGNALPPPAPGNSDS